MKLIDTEAKKLSIFFEQVEPYAIADSFSTAVFLRAKSYLPKVKLQAQSDLLWAFEVMGGQAYYVRLELAARHVAGSCTCMHYDSGAACKHLAAAILWAKMNPQAKKISQKQLVANLINEFETLLDKLNSRWSHNTVVFNAAFVRHADDIIGFVLNGEGLAFAQLWLTIIKKITQAKIFKTLTTTGGYAVKPKWAEAIIFIQVTKAILNSMPILQRLDWLEQLMSAQKDEDIFAKFLFEAVFSIEEIAAVKAYTIANIKSSKNKLPPAFFEVHKDMFSFEEQLQILEYLVRRDEKHYPKIIALLAKVPKQQQKYLQEYYSKHVQMPTKLRSLRTYIKNLTKAGLESKVEPALEAFFDKYVFEYDDDYLYIEKHFPKYLRKFCDNSYLAEPYWFYKSMEANGLHGEMKLQIPRLIHQQQIVGFKTEDEKNKIAQDLWLGFYNKYGQHYIDEAFDFYRQELVNILPPTKSSEYSYFFVILAALRGILPEYTEALIKVIWDSYPKHKTLLKKLEEFERGII